MKLAFFLAQTSSPPYFRKLMKKSFRIPPLRVSVPESAKNRVTSSLWVGSPRVRRIFRMSKLLWVQSDLKLTFFSSNTDFCAWEVLQLLKRTSRAFQNIFYFCPSSNSLGDIGLQRSRTGVAWTKKGPKKGPHAQNIDFSRFVFIGTDVNF